MRIVLDPGRGQDGLQPAQRCLVVTTDLDLHEEHHRLPGGPSHACAAERLVRDSPKCSRVHVFDRSNVQGTLASPRGLRLPSQCRRHHHSLRVIRAPDEGGNPSRTCDDLERRLNHNAKRALCSDEQVDQIHPRRGVVASRELGNVGHHIRRHRYAEHRACCELDLEPAVVARERLASYDVEDVAAGEHDRRRVDPSTCRAVLERCGAGGIGRDRPADECAIEGRNRRVIEADGGQPALQFLERHRGADANAVAGRTADVRQRTRAQDDFTARCRTAGERRLRSDRQHRCRVRDERCHLCLAPGERNAGRESARHVCGIAQERRQECFVCVDAWCGYRLRLPRLDAMSQRQLRSSQLS